MEQFNLEEWLKNKSRKIVTRDGKPVRIVCWDKLGNYPIIGCIKYSDNYEDFETYTINGSKYSFNRKDSNDLFFADEKNTNKILDELKSYLKNTPKEQVERDWKEIQDWYVKHFTNKKHNEKEELTEFEKELQEYYFPELDDFELKRFAKGILDLAKKEVLKDLPKWKKCVGSTGPFIDDFRGEDYLYLNDYVIKVLELFEKLPKEE